MHEILSFVLFFWKKSLIMGVPSFFRWLSEKYPKVLRDAIIASVDGEGKQSQVNVVPSGTEFDNLYLDMNCLIHPCCHPEGKPQPSTEEEMITNVFEYVDKLVAIVRPRRLLYLAIDGVAPRAKMNQQRTRRFRAAQEIYIKSQAEKELREQWISEGKEPPPEKPASWDHNAITPGTQFMDKLAKALYWYINDRLSNNPSWDGIEVIFSDATVPGEGEHKIMQFIRNQRAQCGYDPNLKHVLYGLDADLIMLGLATHELNFSLLRERIEFNNNRNCKVCGKPGHFADQCRGVQQEVEEEPKQKSEFQYLSISVLREYLAAEFYVEGLPFAWDFERVIDDFVFLCFFVGNDFLPHLPSLEIREGALEDLIIVYKRLLPTLGGYMTDCGKVDLYRVGKIVSEVALLEDEVFRKRKERELNWQSREARNAKSKATPLNQKDSKDHVKKNTDSQSEIHETILSTNNLKRKLDDYAETELDSTNPKKRIAGTPSIHIRYLDNGSVIDFRDNEKAIENASKKSVFESEEDRKKTADEFWSSLKSEVDKRSVTEEPEDKKIPWGENESWKKMYYTHKFKFVEECFYVDSVRDVVKSYMEGVCWVMLYYYQGCPSWSWYYPYHYAPCASDFTDIDQFGIQFDLSEPFSPLSQLMAVLPAKSGHCVPEPYRKLMSDTNSPILDLYPLDFESDLNGKKFAWQAVVLLPFLDEKRLIQSLLATRSQLTPEELSRDTLGFVKVFVTTKHAFASEITSLYLKHSNLPAAELIQKKKLINVNKSNGLFGYVAPYSEAHMPGDNLSCVISSITPIQTLRTVSAALFDPPQKVHFSALLSGAIAPSKVLSFSDIDQLFRNNRRFGSQGILKRGGNTEWNRRANNSREVQYLPGRENGQSEFYRGYRDNRRENDHYSRPRDREPADSFRGSHGRSFDYESTGIGVSQYGGYSQQRFRSQDPNGQTIDYRRGNTHNQYGQRSRHGSRRSY